MSRCVLVTGVSLVVVSLFGAPRAFADCTVPATSTSVQGSYSGPCRDTSSHGDPAGNDRDRQQEAAKQQRQREQAAQAEVQKAYAQIHKRFDKIQQENKKHGDSDAIKTEWLNFYKQYGWGAGYYNYAIIAARLGEDNEALDAARRMIDGCSSEEWPKERHQIWPGSPPYDPSLCTGAQNIADTILADRQKKRDELASAAKARARELQAEFDGGHDLLATDNHAAEAAFRDYIGKNPDNPGAYYYLSVALQAQGRWSEALAAMRTGKSKLPAGFSEAAAYERVLQTLESKVNAEKAAADAGALKAAAAIHDRPATIEFDHALALLKAENFAAAETAYREYIGKHPDDTEAYFNLSVALQGQGRWQEALAAMRTGKDKLPAGSGEAASYQHELDFLASKIGKPVVADLSRPAPAKPTGSPTASIPAQDKPATNGFKRGQDLLKADNYPASEAAFRDYIGKNPGDPEGYFNLSVALQAQGGRLQEALAAMQTGRNKLPAGSSEAARYQYQLDFLVSKINKEKEKAAVSKLTPDPSRPAPAKPSGSPAGLVSPDHQDFQPAYPAGAGPKVDFDQRGQLVVPKFQKHEMPTGMPQSMSDEQIRNWLPQRKKELEAQYNDKQKQLEAKTRQLQDLRAKGLPGPFTSGLEIQVKQLQGEVKQVQDESGKLRQFTVLWNEEHPGNTGEVKVYDWTK